MTMLPLLYEILATTKFPPCALSLEPSFHRQRPKAKRSQALNTPPLPRLRTGIQGLAQIGSAKGKDGPRYQRLLQSMTFSRSWKPDSEAWMNLNLHRMSATRMRSLKIRQRTQLARTS